MGPNMLIMRASYSDRGLSARPICNLASVIRSANERRGLLVGASGSVKNGCSDKKTLHCVTKSISLLPFPLLDLWWRLFKLIRRGLGSINAQCAAAAPKNVLATTTREKT
jgi:hypothetical protein